MSSRLIRVPREQWNGEQILVFAVFQHWKELQKPQWNIECWTQEENILSQITAAPWESQSQDVQGFEFKTRLDTLMKYEFRSTEIFLKGY